MTKSEYVENFVKSLIDPEKPQSLEELKYIFDKAKSDPVLNNSQILIVKFYNELKRRNENESDV